MYGIITSKGFYLTVNEEGSIKMYGYVRDKLAASSFNTTEEAQKELDQVTEAKKNKREDLRPLADVNRGAAEEFTSLTTIYSGMKVIEI
jgi:hypothetical protein